MIGIRERIEKVAKAMFLAHHRYRFDLGISLPDAEQQRRFPATSIEQKERGDDPLETMWAALPWKEQLPFEYYAQAALRFLGCVDEKGEVVVLGRGAVGKALEALDKADYCGDKDCEYAPAVETARRALRGEGGER